MDTMEEVIPGSLASVLERNRSRCNGLFESANREGAGIDPDSFLERFGKAVLPLYPRHEPSPDTVMSVYETLLRIESLGITGANTRYPLFQEPFDVILARFPRLLSQYGGVFIALVSGGLLSVMKQGGSTVSSWVGRISGIPSDTSDLDAFRRSGFIAAWLSGMAVYREEALAESAHIPPPVFGSLIGRGIADEVERDRIIGLLESNEWYDPANVVQGEAPVARVAGGFAGFGCEFVYKPRLYGDRDRILATDGLRTYRLYADCFGTSLVRETEPAGLDYCGQADAGCTIADGTVAYGGWEFRLPDRMRVPVQDVVSHGRTVAFTSSVSHRIFVIGFPGANDA